MELRVDFCTWLLALAEPEKDPEFLQLHLFSDKKKFVVHPNRQNERYWAMSEPLVMEENQVQGGKSQMCWTGLINGKIIVHWFDEKETVNQHSYLHMLKTVVWPKVRSVASARGYVFQQDGAPPHTTQMVRDWLASKFGDRVISHKTDRPWPTRSPDLSPLDFWFWGVCLVELRRHPPSSMAELRATINSLARRMSRDEVKKAVNNVSKRAEACIAANGNNFEHLLKKARRAVEE